MKKLKLMFGMLIVLLILPIHVNASGSVGVSTRSINIVKGSSATFTITANNAAGKVDISSNNSYIATVNIADTWVDNNSVTVTVTGVSAGSATINVKLSDVSTYDEEALSGNYSVSVNVTEPQTTTTTTTTTTKAPVTTKPSTNSTTTIITDDLYLSSLNIEGYQINFDKNNLFYQIEVENDVENIKIDAQAGKNITITGIGELPIIVGENSFDIKITNNKNQSKIYNIKINRKEKDTNIVNNNVEEVSKALTKFDIIVINLDKNSGQQLMAQKAILETIKGLNKTIVYNIKDNEKTLYTVCFDGKSNKEIEKDVNLDINIKKYSKNEELKQLKDDKYILLDFKHSGKLPNNTEFKINIENFYPQNNKLNLYSLDDKNGLSLINKEIKIESSYVKFKLDHCSKYILSVGKIQSTNILNIVLCIIMAIELIVVTMLIIYKNKKKVLNQ